jgi:hypothetical protein
MMLILIAQRIISTKLRNFRRYVTVQQLSGTFSLPLAALAIHVFVEGRRKKNNVMDSKRNCISLAKSVVGIHLKTVAAFLHKTVNNNL